MKIPTKAVIAVTKAVATVKKYSPQIMMAVGAVTSVAAVVEAVRKTPEAMDILEEHRQEMEKNKEALELGREDYTQKEYKINTGKIYLITGKKLGKVYLMPIVMETASLMCFFGAHHVMSVRNKNLTVALATTADAFNSYRNRVIEEIGAEKEEKIRLGTKEYKAETFIMDENGKERKVKEKLTVVNPNLFDSPYDILWEEGDPGFDPDPQLRITKVGSVASYFNTILYEKNLVPMVCLNDVRAQFKNRYESYTELGQIVGWDKDSDDQCILLRTKEVSVPDKENPNIYHDAVIISPNISGSIVKEFIK